MELGVFLLAGVQWVFCPGNCIALGGLTLTYNVNVHTRRSERPFLSSAFSADCF